MMVKYKLKPVKFGAKVEVKGDTSVVHDRDSSYMKEVGQKFAKRLPADWKVKITAGPWRSYDINGDVDEKKKTVNIDMYSVAIPVNPRYVDEMVQNAEAKVVQKLDIIRKKCPTCKGSGFGKTGYGRYGMECEPCGGSGLLEYYQKKLKKKELK